jgi:pimeloyl-ACP methyl ester carboxylesterase
MYIKIEFFFSVGVGLLHPLPPLSLQVLLVDLRCHGASAPLDASLPGPHSVHTAAADILRLLGALKIFPEVLIGHSFGGKVVMSMAQQFAGPAHRLPRPVAVWVLDALPGEIRSGEMAAGADRPADLITMLRTMPGHARMSRNTCVDYLERAGFSEAVARWAATSLAPAPSRGGGEAMEWVFNLDGISEMYSSYEQTDLWALVENPAEGLRPSFVRAERSVFRWGGSDEARIKAAGHPVHMLANSGHWVHSDNPDGLFDILAPTFGVPDVHMRRASRDSLN